MRLVIVAALIALVVVAILLVLAPPSWARITRRGRTIRRRLIHLVSPGQWWPEPDVPVARLPPCWQFSTTTY